MTKEEAIKVIKDNWPEGRVLLKLALEFLIPELKESEDERIRKEIIQSIKDNMCVIHKDKCIAWLEKQGEQKPNFCHHEVDFSGCSEEYRKAYYDGWNNCNQQHAQLEAQQKPTWSEDDEEILEGLNNCLTELEEKNGWRYVYINNKDLELCEVRNWLKFLKERYAWKPSDAQMKLLREVQQALLGKDCHNRFVDFMYELKRLREE